eukprot:TRINITY_DN19995_c0_g1_i1.p1 TRINITY_DN19995_c0_g1~~TRINITY_DN19995_c0_g1_i1.p1  ORF type:complete len:383 (-),score=50.59 TRINITY_DN19995_c0_g1_i1:81-1229(-)
MDWKFLVAGLILVTTAVGIDRSQIKFAADPFKPGSILPLPKFNCPNLPPSPPATNVNKLRPSDIKVVMAIGDSITAGFGMHSGRFWDVMEALVEYRGDVFSIGGDGNYTIASYLSNFNTKGIVGPSVGWTFPWDAISWENQTIEPWEPDITRLNGAQSGAKIHDLPPQIDYITNQLLTTYNESVDMENDWKMMTIFVGANNLCRTCNGDYDPDYFEKNLEGLVQKIYDQIPRTFVSILQLFNISQVYHLAEQSDYCMFMWDNLCECPCMCKNATAETRTVMDEHSVYYNERIENVAQNWQNKNLGTFTVKVQPFLRDMMIPDIVGLSALSSLDCFHPSWFADAVWSIGYWNNLMAIDQSSKETAVDYMDTIFTCPNSTTVLS